MRIFREPSENHIPTIATIPQPNINNRNMFTYYETNTTPFTIVLPCSINNAAAFITHIMIEGSNIGTYSVTPGTISNQSITTTWTDRSNVRQVDVRAIGTSQDASSVSFVINTKQNASLPVKIYRIFALEQWFSLPADRCFRDINFESSPNFHRYESLYDDVSLVERARQPLRNINLFARFRAESERNNMVNTLEQLPQFVFEYEVSELPREVYRAYYDGPVSSAYTTTYKGSGFNLGFRIRER